MMKRITLSLAIALLGLAGCAGGGNVTTVATPLGPALLQTSDGGTLVHVGGTDYPLNDFKQVEIVGFMSASGNPVMLISGNTNGCSKRFAVLTVTNSNAEVTKIGECGEGYVFGGDGTNAFISQVSVEDPKIWAFENGHFNGPVLRSVMYPKPTKSTGTNRWRRNHR